jgi:hypothetical protein
VYSTRDIAHSTQALVCADVEQLAGATLVVYRVTPCACCVEVDGIEPGEVRTSCVRIALTQTYNLFDPSCSLVCWEHTPRPQPRQYIFPIRAFRSCW